MNLNWAESCHIKDWATIIATHSTFTCHFQSESDKQPAYCKNNSTTVSSKKFQSNMWKEFLHDILQVCLHITHCLELYS